MNYSKERSRWWSGSCYHKEQLDLIISHLDVKDYAYALHDKDLKEDGSGELKKPHWHFLINILQAQRGSWFKPFCSDDMGFVFHQAARSPQGAYDYLIHDTNPARKAGKYQYDQSIRVSTFEKFDEEEKEADKSQVLFDDMKMVISGEMSSAEFYEKDPKRVHSATNIERTMNQMRSENKFADDFRKLEISYIFGKTGKNKTRTVMEKYGYRNVFRLTNYNSERTTFDGYKDQDVMVFEEFRGKIPIEQMLNYLDGYPLTLPSRYFDKEARYTKVYLVTNVRLSEVYRGMQDEHPGTWLAFYRRIKHIYNFDRDGLMVNVRPPDPPDTEAERKKSDKQIFDELMPKLKSAEDGYTPWLSPKQQNLENGMIILRPEECDNLPF